jgi:hypothetical protein
MRALRLAALALTCNTAWAITCTPLNYPATVQQGATIHEATVNGIDGVSYSKVRFQWTSDAAANPINFGRTVYATHAQWIANGGVIIAGTAGTNYNVQYSAVNGYYNATTNAEIQGQVVTNLAPNTLYHIAGQSSTDGGATFCPAVEETFTTLPYTGVVAPGLPQTFNPTVPTITGTDYTVGTSPCNVGTTAGAQFQDCLTNKAHAGDGIGIVPGTPVQTAGVPFYTPTNLSATPITNINVGTSTFTVASLGSLTNGTQIHVGDDIGSVPNPLQEGFTYSIVNVNTGAKTFQISLDGTNPVTILGPGTGTTYVIPYPITQNYVLIHSTASSSLLPPAGVRLDPVAYSAQLGKIQLTVPDAAANQIIQFTGALPSYLYFHNIEFDTLPNAPAGLMDPYPYGEIFGMNPQADHIVFDQCYFHAAPPPDRIKLAATWAGTNQAIINSYFDNQVLWVTSDDNPSFTSTTTTVTIPVHNFTYVVSGNTKVTCALASPATLTFSGATGGSFYIYWTINPCMLTANLQTGVTASGSSFNIINSASPTFPTTPTGIGGTVSQTDLVLGQGTWSGSAVSYGNYGTYNLTQYSGNTGIQLGGGPGPYNFSNNYFAGQTISPVYWDEYIGDYCSASDPQNSACRPITNDVNLTLERNTAEMAPYLIPTNAQWDGSWWFGRNLVEMKEGRYLRYNGNKFGPIYQGLAIGECWLLWNAQNTDLTPISQDSPNVLNTADITLTNNTCLSGGGITLGGGAGGGNPAIGMQRVVVQNNLFNLNNGYTQNPAPTGSNSQSRAVLMTATESVNINHNTWYLAAGNSAVGGPAFAQHLAGGTSITNNILNYDSDYNYTQGFNSGGLSGDLPNPGSFVNGNALLFASAPWTGLYSTTFRNNVYLCQWSDSINQVDITNSACAAFASNYPSSTYFPNAGSTLASRVAGVHWNNPVSGARLQLTYQSAYISGGANHGTDGLDIGADIDQLEAAQGKVSNARISLTSTTAATVSFLAPDASGCSVDYGTSNFPSGAGTWTRVANAGGQRVQNVNLTGLITGTLYTYRINCAAMQPTGTFTTH